MGDFVSSRLLVERIVVVCARKLARDSDGGLPSLLTKAWAWWWSLGVQDSTQPVIICERYPTRDAAVDMVDCHPESELLDHKKAPLSICQQTPTGDGDVDLMSCGPM